MKFRIFVALLLLPILARANISSQSARSGPFIITGSPQVIPVGFPFQQGSDLTVVDIGTSGTPHAPVTLTLGSDYSVSGGSYNTQSQMLAGSISVVAGGVNAVQTSDQIVILRNVPVNQITSFAPTGPLTIALVEQALDKQATLSQELTETTTRSLRFPQGEAQDGTMPLASRKGKVLGFDNGGLVQFFSVPLATVSSNAVNQLSTGQFYQNSGALINRFNDRVLIAGAAVSDAQNPQGTSDWLSTYYNTLGGYTGYQVAGDLSVQTGTNAHDNNAISAAARTLNNTSSSASAIAGDFVVINNNPSFSTAAWALYAEGQQVAAGVNATLAAEFSCRALLASVNPNPFQQGSVIGLQLSAGCGVTAVGQNDDSAAIQIVSNPMKWQKGIVFGATSITGTDGVTGFGTAIALAKNHALGWFVTGGANTTNIYSSVATANLGQNLFFSDSGTVIQDFRGNSILLVQSNAAAIADYIAIAGSVSGGNNTTITATGTDANVDLTLTPKGTGKVRSGGGILTSSPSGGIGYSTGAGNTQIQSTSKATAFSLNRPCGAVQTAGDALAAGAIVSATWSNTASAQGDVMIINHVSGGTIGAYTFNAVCGAGSITLYIRNATAGSLSEAITFQYVIIKGTSS